MKKAIISVIFVIMLLSISLYTPLVESVNISKDLPRDDISTQNIGNYYAVLAACAQYKDPSANLRIEEFKLKKLYRGLISNSNWKDENIILLVNDEGDPTNPGYSGGATRENIINALIEMAGKVGKNDVFVFSWQGHGSEIPESETSGINDDYETDGFDEVTCAYDSYRDVGGFLHNYITDDEFDYYFSQIKAKGMLLIFESCFSGGLVGNSIGDRIFENDVDGPGRIVIVSTLDGTLGRGSYIFGFPMTWTMGDAFDKNSLLGGPAGVATITAEDAFNWARPKIFAENSIFWFGVWAGFFFIEYEYQRQENGLKPGAALIAALQATAFTFLEFCYVQIMIIIKSGSPGFNWPHMIDNYNPLIGEKELTIVDNT